MTKEFLSSHGFAYTEVNVLLHPAALARLVASAKMPPVVERNGKLATGYNRRSLRRLLGV